MKKLRTYILYISVMSILASCEKEDEPVILPAPGGLEVGVAPMGIDYGTQVYFDFATGKSLSAPCNSYDLAFESSPAGYRVYLNTGKLMFAYHTGTSDFAVADTFGINKVTDSNQLDDDSTAIGDWTAGSEVIVIDRGRVYHSGNDRWRKIKLDAVDGSSYRMQYCRYDTGTVSEIVIPKDPDYSLVYFSFGNAGEIVQVAPPKDSWDVVFTRFTHTYWDEPPSSPFKYYLVTGAILNRWNDEFNACIRKDSTAGYKPFIDLSSTDIGTYQMGPGATIIGFDWKYYDFNLGYIIYPDRYYLLEDEDGFYFKVRFIDFYDPAGNKGTATFEYQRL